jgi:tight adherence protein B
MTALAWLALAGAILGAPRPSALPARLRALTTGGRLHAPTDRRRQRPVVIDAESPAAIAGAAGVAGVLSGAVDPALGLAAGVLTATGGVVVRSGLIRRRAGRERAELIAAARTLVAELQVGSRPAEALQAAAELAPAHAAALRDAAERAAVGSDVSTVLGRDAAVPGLVALGHAWRVAEASGAPVADVLARVAEDLEDGRRREQAVSAALAGSRSSALMLAVLPAVGLLLGGSMGADPLGVLIGTPAGRAVCVAGAVFDAAGVLWTLRITSRAERA